MTDKSHTTKRGEIFDRPPECNCFPPYQAMKVEEHNEYCPCVAHVFTEENGYVERN